MKLNDLSRLRRSLSEMLLIVVSILLAFSLDAWWDDRERAAQQVQELQAIRTEMRENIANVNAVIVSVSEHAANVDALISALAQAGDTPVAVPNQWLGSVITWRTADVSTGTLELIKVSGGLRRIREPDLRSALASFSADLLDFTEDEEIGRDFAEYVVSPVLARQGLGRVAYRHRLGFREHEQGGETLVTANPELLGLLQARRVHWHWSEQGLPILAGYMELLADAIDDYLAGRPVNLPSREAIVRPDTEIAPP